MHSEGWGRSSMGWRLSMSDACDRRAAIFRARLRFWPTKFEAGSPMYTKYAGLRHSLLFSAHARTPPSDSEPSRFLSLFHRNQGKLRITSAWSGRHPFSHPHRRRSIRCRHVATDSPKTATPTSDTSVRPTQSERFPCARNRIACFSRASNGPASYSWRGRRATGRRTVRPPYSPNRWADNTVRWMRPLRTWPTGKWASGMSTNCESVRHAPTKWRNDWTDCCTSCRRTGKTLTT